MKTIMSTFLYVNKMGHLLCITQRKKTKHFGTKDFPLYFFFSFNCFFFFLLAKDFGVNEYPEI